MYTSDCNPDVIPSMSAAIATTSASVQQADQMPRQVTHQECLHYLLGITNPQKYDSMGKFKKSVLPHPKEAKLHQIAELHVEKTTA